MRQLTSLSLFLSLALGVTATAKADITASNLVDGVEHSASTDLSNIAKKAFLFSVGASPLQLSSVDVMLRSNNAGVAASVTGGIYSVESDAPGSLLASFGSAAVTSFSFEQRSLTTGGLFTLQANTSYAILLERVAGSETANWGRTTDATIGS